MIILSNGIAHERMASSDCKNASWSGTFAMSFISLVTKKKICQRKMCWIQVTVFLLRAKILIFVSQDRHWNEKL